MVTEALFVRFCWDASSPFCSCSLSPSLSSSHPWSLLSASRSILKSTSVSSSILPSSSSPDTSESRSDGHFGDDAGLVDDISAQEDAMLLALHERKTGEAWRIYELLMRRKHVPNSVCLSRLVSQLSYAGSPSSLTKAQRLVASLQKLRMVDLLDCNSLGLLAMATAKAGAERYAVSVIRLMLKLGYHPHVKAWSAVVSKLSKNKEDVPLALSIFEEICSTVRAAEAKSQSLGDSVRSVTTMRPDTAAFNAALNACANAGLVEKACEILDDLSRFQLKPDVLTFNILIKLYAMSDNIDKLCTIFNDMEAAGVDPDLSTMHSLVAAFVGLDDLETAVAFVQALRDGGANIAGILVARMGTLSAGDPEGECLPEYDGDAPSEMADLVGDTMTETVNLAIPESFVDMSANKVVLDNISTKNTAPKFSFKPDTRMYTILMKGYMQKGRLKDVMQILSAMQSQGNIDALPNEVSYTTAISTCVRLGLLDEARSILLQMAAQNVPANAITYNVLLKGYSKAGQIPKGRLLLEDMKKAGIQPDVISYNTLIDGYINIDDSVSALAVFTEMRNAGIAPSRVSYTMLIKAFGNNGQPHLAAKVFEEMEQDRRVKVDTIAWNTLIECYSKAGDADGAKQSFHRMKQCGYVPTIATYGSLLKAFSIGKKAGEALVLWNEIKDRLEPANGSSNIPLEPDAGLLDGFVDICVREGFFLKALEILACMEKYKIPADRIKYKRMFVELHSKLYTSQYTSQARRDRTADRRRAVEAFKFWLGLPNNYYASDWSP